MVEYKDHPEPLKSVAIEPAPPPPVIVDGQAAGTAFASHLFIQPFIMGTSTHTGSPIKTPSSNPEISPDTPKGPTSPPSPPKPILPNHPEEPAIDPEIDPDRPQKPGPPLSDPETPHGSLLTKRKTFLLNNSVSLLHERAHQLFY